MTFAALLSLYLHLNLLLLGGFVALSALLTLLRRSQSDLPARAKLKLHYVGMSVILLYTALQPFLPRNELFSPPAKLWSSASLKSFDRLGSFTGHAGVMSVSTPLGTSSASAELVTGLWLLAFVAFLLIGGALVLRDLRRLLLLRRKAFLIRKIGRVKVFVSETCRVPFSFWLPGEANVVVPVALIQNPLDFRIALVHELQHHRQRDTKWAYVFWFLRILCSPNPAIHLWSRQLSEIQEFACDETLLGQRKVSSRDYARCLIEAAKSALDQRSLPACAPGLISLFERKQLNRRIEMILERPTARAGRAMTVAIGALLVSVLGATALASSRLVQDRRVTMTQATQMAERAQQNSGFPVVVNEQVLRELNRYLGTPDGREFMRQSLARMENHKTAVLTALGRYQLPAELLAVPIVESGYKNLAQGQSSPTVKSAGIWQFIPSTARNYGLTVNAQLDERLDLSKATDAALRYLQSNKLRFNDWHLSALAYNMGEEAVQRGINATGSRDAFALIRNGYEGDKGYLAKLNAAILIMRNPESLE